LVFSSRIVLIIKGAKEPSPSELRERVRFLARNSLTKSVACRSVSTRGNPCFHLINACYEHCNRASARSWIRLACRLRAAGVCAEDREALLGHANHSMAGHYASADVGHLLKQVNLLLDRSGTRTVLRVADGQRRRGDERSHTVPQQERRTWFCPPNP
jgi:hypothetical protein